MIRWAWWWKGGLSPYTVSVILPHVVRDRKTGQSFQSRKPHAWKGPRSKGFWPEEGAWKYYSGTNKGEHGKEKQISVVAMWARPFLLERQPREVMPMSSRVGGASSAKLTSLSLLWSRCHGGSQVTCHLTQRSFIIEPRVSVQVS